MSALIKSLEKYIPIWLKAYTVKFLAIYPLIQYNHSFLSAHVIVSSYILDMSGAVLLRIGY